MIGRELFMLEVPWSQCPTVVSIRRMEPITGILESVNIARKLRDGVHVVRVRFPILEVCLVGARWEANACASSALVLIAAALRDYYHHAICQTMPHVFRGEIQSRLGVRMIRDVEAFL